MNMTLNETNVRDQFLWDVMSCNWASGSQHFKTASGLIIKRLEVRTAAKTLKLARHRTVIIKSEMRRNPISGYLNYNIFC